MNNPPPAVDCKNSDPQKQFDYNLKVLKQQEMMLRPFPIGWPGNAAELDFWGWILKFLGCLWTGLALSLGAPFWFDLLQKFMNIRGAGTNPDDEKTKKKNENAAQPA